MPEVYLNPFTDFGFKKIFGEEASKPLLIDFLNSLLPAHSQIKTLTFKNLEQLPKTEPERKAVYDIFCENEKGEQFIVELQKVKQSYFKDRTVFYSTFPIQEQAEKGEWDFRLTAVYCISILDFRLNDHLENEATNFISKVYLKDQNNTIFYDKLAYFFLEMPNFKKKENELENRLDQWLYFIKHLEDFQNIPSIFKDEVFAQAFETARIAKLKEEEMNAYQQSLKALRDDYAIKSMINTLEANLAEEKAKAAEEKLDIARNLKKMGLTTDQIIEATGLDQITLEKLE
jgi:predicted transposase/invertase (TIGR01784 family)